MAKTNIEFRRRLLNYIDNIASECLPESLANPDDNDWMDIDAGDNSMGDKSLTIGSADDHTDDVVSSQQTFQPLPDPDCAEFEKVMRCHVKHIVCVRQIHNPKHNPTCYKYGTRCRFRFPRKIVLETRFDEATGVVYVRRTHPYVNNYNKWFTIITRGNHDIQFLFTKKHALAIIHYIMKYISKPEASLHSKLTVAAAL